MYRRRERFHVWLEKLGSETIIDKLGRYVSEARIEKIRTVVANRLTTVQVAVENPANIHNALALVRSAEGFGIQGMHLIDVQNRKRPRGRQTTQGATHWMDIHHYKQTRDFIEYAKGEGLTLAGGVPGAEITLSEIPIDRPLCVVLGNEERGLTEEALSACDIHYSIPMHGMSQSLNLSVSGALTLFDISSRKRASMEAPGDFNSRDQHIELAWHLFRSIGEDRAHKYLNYHNGEQKFVLVKSC